VMLNINTLGDAESRASYRAALVEFFAGHAEALSAESKIRLEKNPMRILDSKDEGDRRIVAGAPGSELFLSSAAQEFYENLQRDLNAFGVPFVQNPNIVRGLDYYNHTAFEFVTSALGAQGTVMGGGRYDGLVEQMGGPKVPGIGWGAGIDRLAMLIENIAANKASVIIIPEKDDVSETSAIETANALRAGRIPAEISFQSGMKNGLKYANRMNAKWAVLVNQRSLILKHLDDGAQSEVALDDLVARFSE